MVKIQRSWKGFSAVGIAAALAFALGSCLVRTWAADDTSTTTTNAKTTTAATKKTSRPVGKAAKAKKSSAARRRATSRKIATTRKQSSTPLKATVASAHATTAGLYHPPAKPMKPVPLTPLEPVRIEMGDGTPLETFFQSLAKVESLTVDAPAPSVVHIIHFGDSHVASDYWAGVLREDLQARFGDAGPGFVLPGRPWSTIRYVQARSLDGSGWRTDGLRFGENDGVVGLGGMSLESYHEANPASALAPFSQFEVLAAATPGADCWQVQVDGSDVHDITSDAISVIAPPAPPAPNDLVPEPSPKSLGGGAAALPGPAAPLKPVRRRWVRRIIPPPTPPYRPWPADSPLDFLDISNPSPLAAAPHRISIRSTCGSKGRLLGMELQSGAKGVLYDTDGVNGARLVDLEKPLPALRKALLDQARPALIIVSYGTNDIGTKDFTSAGYEEGAFQILSKLKADAGDASILVTGPTDRGSPRKRMRDFIQAAQAELQPALRRAALRAGCAFWDQQAAMGGTGAMTRWVRAGLGQYDYVHFTSPGYKKLADLLYAQLMAEYSKFQKAGAGQ